MGQENVFENIISFATVLWVVTKRSSHERCVTTPKTAAYYFHMALDEFLIRDHFNRTKIQTPNCSKFLVNWAKILNFPVWTKCQVKFFRRWKIRPMPCVLCQTNYTSKFTLSIDIYYITSATRTVVSHWWFLSRGLGVNKGWPWYLLLQTFDPLRFMVENKEQRSPYAYIPFSAGPRCVSVSIHVRQQRIKYLFILSLVIQ